MFSQLFNRFEELFIAFALAVMTLITFSQVIGRYFFNTSAPWALELTGYCFAWMVLFGMSYGVRVGAHIGIDAFVRLLPASQRRLMSLLSTALCILYCVIVFIGAIKYVYTIYDLGIEATDIPIAKWIPYSILPVGFALLGFRFIQVFLKILQHADVKILVDEAQELIREHKDNQVDVSDLQHFISKSKTEIKP